MSKSTELNICGKWTITQVHNETGEILYREESDNIVVKTGRTEVLKLLFNLSGSTFLFLGAGASSTAATVDDVKLVYEHIADSARKSLTDNTGGALDSGDIIDDVTTISGCDFYKSLNVRATYDGSTDPNVDQPFQEYGLFSTGTLPGTPTGTSGTMFNRFIGSQQIILDSSTTIIVDVIVHV